ncbi:hypothetical protein FHT08_002928 [Xanthomonas campestris]|nr:hypothetical protein [Xanthomonas sp. CFBP 8152]NIJ77808.1 hypothetical protein [Xanthomonas sp. CFBP 8151]
MMRWSDYCAACTTYLAPNVGNTATTRPPARSCEPFSSF